MHVADLLMPERIECGVPGNSKKRVLERLSALVVAGQTELSQTEVFESLIARERLGSTALGKGIAIPHGRLKSTEQSLIAFMRLNEGVDFDAPDGEPVDLVCALVVPEESTEEHLQILAQLTEMFSDSALREKLREAENEQRLYELLLEWSEAKEH